jgi:aromatic ring-opening dioxygenase catalytic subunit (LigB family)
MSIVFAGTISHAPGFTAWPHTAQAEQKDALYDSAAALRARLAAAEVDALILFTSEHWTNFFLDHMSAMVVGLADSYSGPTEPWLNIERFTVQGEPNLGAAIVREAYAADIEPGFAHELVFDHGTMIPLQFLTPDMATPVVPIMFNTLAPPQPSPARCFALGEAVGRVARASSKRIGLVATGGMSHDPGERGHGTIDEAFDRRFIAALEAGDADWLRALPLAELTSRGAGTPELLAWIALAGALGSFRGETLTYQAVKPWATGMGMMAFELA